jgi:hypothetical protein
MEYYFVDSLEDYDQVYRAVAFFIHKYGRIDWLESLNEYWLPVDARLRTDFNIAVGTREDKIGDLVRKSRMKRIFIDSGIPTARQHIVSDLKAAKAFVKQVGYPVIVKPDIGVGANGTMKINGEDELAAFYNELPQVPYVMEEFLCGDICTYDAILDADCEPLFESMCTYPPVIDAVQNDDFIVIYHNCGDNVPKMLPSILSTGCAAYHFGNAVDMEKDIIAQLPLDTIVMGNVDPAGVLRMGTPESVRAETQKVLERCAKYPNFVLSSGCDIPPMTPWENLDAFFAASDEFYEK